MYPSLGTPELDENVRVFKTAFFKATQLTKELEMNHLLLKAILKFCTDKKLFRIKSKNILCLLFVVGLHVNLNNLAGFAAKN